MFITLETEAGRALVKNLRMLAIARGEMDPNEPFSKKDLNAMEMKVIEKFLEEAWAMLEAQNKKSLADAMQRQTQLFIKEGPLRDCVRTTLSDLVKQMLELKETELRAQVAKEFDARWQAAVEAVVADRLEKAIAKIKSEFGR